MVTDTEVSELDPSEGDRPTNPPPSFEEQLGTLAGALGEANALSILSREASERCANLCATLLSRLAEGDKLFRAHDLRLTRLEQHLGLEPLR